MFVDHAAVLGLRKQVGGPARKANTTLFLVCILPISSAGRHPASPLRFLGFPYSREGPGLLGGHRSASREVIPRASGAEPERQVKSLVPPHLRRTGRGPGAAMTMIPLDGAAQPLPLIRAPYGSAVAPLAALHHGVLPLQQEAGGSAAIVSAETVPTPEQLAAALAQ